MSVSGSASTSVPYNFILKGIEVIANPWITLEFRSINDTFDDFGDFGDLHNLIIVDDSYKHFIFAVNPEG
jgi:hypothetical protein